MSFATLYTKARSSHALKKAWRTVRKIGDMEARVQSMSDDELKNAFLTLAAMPLAERTVPGFAFVREAARRALGLRPFDVQLIGGLTLLQGKLAEMRTGEGKTLTIVAPAALLALDKRGVHVVTANSYLAARDAELMAPVYNTLGLTVAATLDGHSLAEKQAAYAADITYGVGHEFGFDYLKDNLAKQRAGQCQRPLYAAIVDEIDSILIDEARTPMVISGQAADVGPAVRAIDRAVSQLAPGVDFEVQLKEQQASLTEAGYTRVEISLAEQGVIASPKALYDAQNLALVRRVHAAVKAYGLFRRDRDYVLENGELVLVDQSTGRKMVGRRFDDGLHEALEAKEGLKILPGTVTRATITYQSFFALYERLAGLTGTALTEAEEFSEIYNLETVVIPTNKPVQRLDLEDLVFMTKSEKFAAVAEEVARRQQTGQPVLLGCATIRDAEVVSLLLTKKGVRHEVLTAKYLEREAHIIAQAGARGAVTVATNMAGRGTDISLGGEKPSASEFESKAEFDAAYSLWEKNRDEVVALGGLYVLGTERNGIRRVDNQLAGRSGRQGDPGQVQFYLSLEDELLRVFGKSGKLSLLRRMVSAAGGALGGKQVREMVRNSQRKYENQGFDARKNLLGFDKALSHQRRAVYSLRDHLLTEGAQEYCRGAVGEAIQAWCAANLPADTFPEQWDVAAAKRGLQDTFGLTVPIVGWVHKDSLNIEEIHAKVIEAALGRYDELTDTDEARVQEVFSALDELWTEHLTALDELRQNVSLKQHTGLNATFQYHNDAFKLFKSFEEALTLEVASRLMNREGRTARAEVAAPAATPEQQAETRVAVEQELRWIFRNEVCPCGSGKRYKHCHGKLA